MKSQAYTNRVVFSDESGFLPATTAWRHVHPLILKGMAHICPRSLYAFHPILRLRFNQLARGYFF